MPPAVLLLRPLSVILALVAVAPLATAEIVVVAGASGSAASPESRLHHPFGIDFDRKGAGYIVEMTPGNRLLRLSPDGALVHIAGTGNAVDEGDNGPPLEASFHGPHNLAVAPDNSILIADTWNGRVRRVDLVKKLVTSLPGYGVAAQDAKKSGPYCITLDFAGKTLYIADLLKIQQLDLASGELRTVAGNGQKGRPEDGALAVESPLVDPRAVAPDRKGNVYILERGGHALRVVTPDGKIRTVVNTSGKKGVSVDDGPAAEAAMNGPKHLCVDRDDNVLIADSENHAIRKYLPAQERIVRIAGTGKQGSGDGGGDPLACELNRPHGVTVHPITGEIYIVDSENHRILKIAR